MYVCFPLAASTAAESNTGTNDNYQTSLEHFVNNEYILHCFEHLDLFESRLEEYANCMRADDDF